MKLVGEETRKRELFKFYAKTRDIYDEVYFEWRDLQKSYIEYDHVNKQS